MGSEKEKPASTSWLRWPVQLFRWLFGPGRGWTLGLLLVVGFIAGGAALWKRFGPRVTASPEYRLTAEKITITPPPEWVRSDVKAAAVRDGNLQGASILEPELSLRIARAFELNSWVARVRRVRKRHPAKVEVDIEYRRPVAMVEVRLGDQPGLLPVDAEGYVLPPEDFSPEEARSYPRINIGQTSPRGPAGTKWGEPKIAAAASVAAAFGHRWQELGLYRIVPLKSAGASTSQFAIHTRGDVRILWGSAPSNEQQGEASAAQKIKRLQSYVRRTGRLDREKKPLTIDVRSAGDLAVTTRTASSEDDATQ